MEILENNSTNWLIMTPDGGTELKTKSSELNQLLYGFNLWGLLDTGNEIWTQEGSEDEPKITIIPGEDAKEYTIQMEDAPDLRLGAHHKTDLIEALREVYETHEGNSVSPIVELYDEIRENMIRHDLLDNFLNLFSDKVAGRETGWYINGHVLLTYEGKFFHPSTESRKRDGQQVINQGSSMQAYSVSINDPSEAMSRNVTVDGEQYRLTDKEMMFLAKAMWAIKNTPDRRNNSL